MSKERIAEEHRRTRLLAAEVELGVKHLRTVHGKKRRSVIVYRDEAEKRELESAVAMTEKNDRKGRILLPCG